MVTIDQRAVMESDDDDDDFFEKESETLEKFHADEFEAEERLENRFSEQSYLNDKVQNDRLKSGDLLAFRAHQRHCDVSANKLMFVLLKYFGLRINRRNILVLKRRETQAYDLKPYTSEILRRLFELNAINAVFINSSKVPRYWELADFEKYSKPITIFCDRSIHRRGSGKYDVTEDKWFLQIILTNLFYRCLFPQMYQIDWDDIDHFRHLITVEQWYQLIVNLLNGIVSEDLMKEICQVTGLTPTVVFNI